MVRARSILGMTVHKVKVRHYPHRLPAYNAAERTVMMTPDMGESQERCLKQMVEFEIAQ